MTEKFSLKWNDYHSNVAKSFRNLRNSSDFTDVTLVGDDQKLVYAHKVVLSSCSSFFNNILRQISNTNPLLCIYGLDSSDIYNVLDYIYNGEVQIHQEKLDSFLKVAQRLQLEGLLESELENVENKVEERIKIDNEEELYNFEDDAKTMKNNHVLNSANPVIKSNDDLGIEVEKYLLKTQNGYQCDICKYIPPEKYLINQTFMKGHIENHLEGLSFNCNNCQKTFSKRATLRKHKSRGGCQNIKG